MVIAGQDEQMNNTLETAFLMTTLVIILNSIAIPFTAVGYTDLDDLDDHEFKTNIFKSKKVYNLNEDLSDNSSLPVEPHVNEDIADAHASQNCCDTDDTQNRDSINDESDIPGPPLAEKKTCNNAKYFFENPLLDKRDKPPI